MVYRISNQERELLYGLPHIQQLLYLVGLRPFMDFATGIVGIKRGISHRSLQEALFVESHQGRCAVMPSREQIRRALRGLAAVGAIEIQSEQKRLILKCLVADRDNSVPKKADTPSTYQADRSIYINNHDISESYCAELKKATILKFPKADTPPVSGIKNIKTHTLSIETKSLISLDFVPAATTIEKAKLMQYDNASSPRELARFIAFHKSKGTESYDWDAEYFYWVLGNTRNQQGGNKRDSHNKTSGGKQSLSAIERVAYAHRYILQDNPVYEASDNHPEGYCLPVDIDG